MSSQSSLQLIHSEAPKDCERSDLQSSVVAFRQTREELQLQLAGQ